MSKQARLRLYLLISISLQIAGLTIVAAILNMVDERLLLGYAIFILSRIGVSIMDSKVQQVQNELLEDAIAKAIKNQEPDNEV